MRVWIENSEFGYDLIIGILVKRCLYHCCWKTFCFRTCLPEDSASHHLGYSFLQRVAEGEKVRSILFTLDPMKINQKYFKKIQWFWKCPRAWRDTCSCNRSHQGWCLIPRNCVKLDFKKNKILQEMQTIVNMWTRIQIMGWTHLESTSKIMVRIRKIFIWIRLDFRNLD